MATKAKREFCGRTRREFLWETGGGFGAAALTSLLSRDGFFAQPGRRRVRRRQSARAEAAASCRRRPRASSSCSCTAGRATSIRSTTSRAWSAWTARRSPSRRSAAAATRTKAASSSRSGSSSSTASAASGSATCSRTSASCVDDIAFLHSMTADSPIHGSAMLMMNSGKTAQRQPVPRLVGQLRPGQRRTRTCPASS